MDAINESSGLRGAPEARFDKTTVEERSMSIIRTALSRHDNNFTAGVIFTKMLSKTSPKLRSWKWAVNGNAVDRQRLNSCDCCLGGYGIVSMFVIKSGDMAEIRRQKQAAGGRKDRRRPTRLKIGLLWLRQPPDPTP
jgi:hypothetical protein